MKGKYLECSVCRNRTMIQRKNSKNRGEGHIKHLWCFRCKARRPHIERDEFKDDFSKNVDELERKVMVRGATQ